MQQPSSPVFILQQTNSFISRGYSMKRSTGINCILIFLKTENIHRCNCRPDEDSFVILLTADGTILIELFYHKPKLQFTFVVKQNHVLVFYSFIGYLTDPFYMVSNFRCSCGAANWRSFSFCSQSTSVLRMLTPQFKQASERSHVPNLQALDHVVSTASPS